MRVRKDFYGVGCNKGEAVTIWPRRRMLPQGRVERRADVRYINCPVCVTLTFSRLKITLILINPVDETGFNIITTCSNHHGQFS